MAEQVQSKVRVWDLPTRLFHWSLAVAAVALLITAKVGGVAMVWHGRLGYAVGALLLFRLCWGFVGGYWSRFAAFPPSPRAALQYVRARSAIHPAGHSPLGALSVYALLFFLLAQVASGLFSDDNVEFSGPLGVRVSNATVKLMTRYHKNVGQYILIALVLIHIAAVLYYLWVKRQNLIKPMIIGDAIKIADTPASTDDRRSRLKALVLIFVSAILVYGIVKLGD